MLGTDPIDYDVTEAIITDRTPIAWTKKINPWWWLWNDVQPFPDPGQVKHTGWLGQLEWWVRNPCANFVGFVIGVNDRNYRIIGTAPVWAGSLRDVGRTGWKWSVIDIGLGLPFISYAGVHWEFYLGWRFSGGFGLKIIRHA